jgi:hypothetical protein
MVSATISKRNNWPFLDGFEQREELAIEGEDYCFSLNQ